MNNTFEISLFAEKDKNINLSAFLSELTNIKGVLNKLDSYLTNKRTPTLNYVIKKIIKKNPIYLELELIPKDPKIDCSIDVCDKFVNGIDFINNNKDPKFKSKDVLDSFSNIGKSLGKGIDKIVITRNGNEINLINNLKKNIDNILGADIIEKNFVSGILEALNIHGAQNRFTIYPVAGNKIDCIFPKNLIQEAIKIVNRYIQVNGMVKYKKATGLPYEVSVENYEVFPEENELPILDDIRGMSPDAIGDLNPEEFIRRIRDKG